jgi:hypothetical protein
VRAGKDGARMARAAVRGERDYHWAGRACAGRPRHGVGAVLGPGHPCGDVAVLLVSELFSNSVRFSLLNDRVAMATTNLQAELRHLPAATSSSLPLFAEPCGTG